jgi:hypothetical protein
VRPLEFQNGGTGIEMRFDAFGSNAIGKDGSMLLLKNTNIFPISHKNERPDKIVGASTLHS